MPTPHKPKRLVLIRKFVRTKCIGVKHDICINLDYINCYCITSNTQIKLQSAISSSIHTSPIQAISNENIALARIQSNCSLFALIFRLSHSLLAPSIYPTPCSAHSHMHTHTHHSSNGKKFLFNFAQRQLQYIYGPL